MNIRQHCIQSDQPVKTQIITDVNHLLIMLETNLSRQEKREKKS